MSAASPPHVVIVGSGFGGLFAARALRRVPVRVTLLDRTNHHLFQPLLYQVATGILSSGEIAPPTRDVLRRARHIRVLQGEATELDAGASRLTVRTIDGATEQLEYDWLIAAPGVTNSYFGNPAFEQHTLPMKSLADALALRAQIFSAYERAEWEPDPAVRARMLTFAIVGGGPTGVELAGQLGELSRRALPGEFSNFDPARDTRIALLDAGPRILPVYSERQSRRAAAALERLGVEIHVNAKVTAIDARGLEFAQTGDGGDGGGGGGGRERRIDADTRVWAAGMTASAFTSVLAHATGVEQDRQGRIAVEPDCSVRGYPNVFVVGDVMALDDLPGLAEVAMQSGRHASKMVAADLAGEPRRPLRYLDLGSMAAVSRTSAVATFRGLHFSGIVGWVMWLVVHLFFLTGFKNRVTTVIHWAITFLGRDRSERAVK